MKKRGWIGVAILGVAAMVAWYGWGPRRTPAGQPALTTISQANLPAFQARFDRNPDDAHILLLLSPT